MEDVAPLVAFSSARDIFVVVSDDNRLKLWDTASGSVRQDYAEKKHLSKSYSCLAWGNYAWGKRGKQQTDDELLGTAAIGSSDGQIALWDLARGKVKHRLGKTGNGHTKRVNDVAFAPDGDTLFSCSDEKHAFEWNVETGEMLRKIKLDKGGATKLCVCSDLLAAVGVAATKLYDLSSGKPQKSLSGGSSSACCLAFTCEGRFLLTASLDGRLIDLYECAGSRELPLQTFTCDSSPVSIDAHVARMDSEAATLHVLCSTTTQQLNVWTHRVALEGEDESEAASKKKKKKAAVHKPKTPCGHVVVQGADGSSTGSGVMNGGGFDKFTSSSVRNLKQIHAVDPRSAPAVIHACFCGGNAKSGAGQGRASAGKLMLARGMKAQPRFEVVQYATEGEVQEEIEVAPMAMASTEGEGEGKGDGKDGPAAKRNGVQVAGGAEANGRKALALGGSAAESQIVASVTSSAKRPRTMSVESDGSVSGSGSGSGSGGGAELSIGERLKLLTGDLDFDSKKLEQQADAADAEAAERGHQSSPTKRARLEGGTGADGVGKKSAGKGKGVDALPKADSLAGYLEQALHTNDDAMLEKCLETRDATVIDATVSRLQPARVIPFLQKVIARFERRPTRGAHLTDWIQAVILRHTAFLVTVPQLTTRLGGFYRAIHDRVAHFRSFLKLSGKLDLILSQVEQRHGHGHAGGGRGRGRGGADEEEGREAKRPKVVYYEGEEDKDEEEDEEEEGGQGGGAGAGEEAEAGDDDDEEDDDDDDDDDEED